MVSPYLEKFVLPETYFILFDYGKLGLAFDETEPGFSRKDCVHRLVTGDYNASKVVAIYRVTTHSPAENVTEDIAREVLIKLLDDPASHLVERMDEWLGRNVPDAEVIIREHMREVA